MDRSSTIALQFIEALDIQVKLIETFPDSGIIMFPPGNVEYGLVNPSLLSSEELADNVCCILGSQKGVVASDKHGMVERIEYLIPIFALYHIERDYTTDPTGRSIIETQYHFIQEMIDLVNNKLCNWFIDELTASVESFELNDQIGKYEPWYYGVPILPPYYCTRVTLKVSIGGSFL